ncbi:MAG TPA: GTP-binding protein [Burkholderiales bacterium]|nr:GTP-binding protein [Burkholderiales bacterium]
MVLVAGRIPVVLITGFLGSGKTTLLNRLLQQPALADSAVIINEFGEIGIDHLLVSTPAENMVLLDTGCLCCTVRGDLVETLADLQRKRESGIVPRFGHLLIETTGLADPVPVLQSIVSDPALRDVYVLENVVSLVDAVNGDAQLDRHPESVKQAAVADALLITKTDIAPADSVIALKERLRRLNPGAELHEVVGGRIDAAKLRGTARGLDRHSKDIEHWLRTAEFEMCEHRHHGAAEKHRHDSGVRAFAFYYDRPIRRAGFTMWLDMLAGLRGANLLRVKALLNVEGDPVVVNAVQTVVHEPFVLERWPGEDRRSRLVFIARDMEREEIERTFDAFDFAPASLKKGAFDPAAYAQFVDAMRGFR